MNGKTKPSDRSFLVFIGIGIVPVLIAAFLLIRSIQIYRSPKPSEPPYPVNVPRDIPLLYTTVSAAQVEYLVPIGMDPDITVNFENKSSFKKLWNGKSAIFLITEPKEILLSAKTHTETWGKTLVGQGTGDPEFTPWLSVVLPIEEANLHHWIVAKAYLDVTYPSSQSLSFSNKTAHMERTVRFFVISKADEEMILNHNDWEETISGNAVWEVLPCAGIILAFGVLFIVLGGMMYRDLKKAL